MGHNVLITGGAGALARFVAEELRKDNNVVLFDRIAPHEHRMPWKTDLFFVKGDLTSLADCMRAITLAKADVIIHLGAIPYPTDLQPGRQFFPQMLPEDTTMQTNVMGTYYLMDAARRIGTVKKVLFASTYYVLGLGNRISGTPYKVEYLPIDEEHPCHPEDTYGLSKLMGEQIIEAYSRAYGFKAVAFRLMGISNPNNPYKFNFTPEPTPGHKGGPINTTYQYVDSRDVAYACRLAIEKDLDNDFEVFYLITDNQYPGDTSEIVKSLYPDLKDMADNIKGKEGIITYRKIRELLGYEPKHSWRNQE